MKKIAVLGAGRQGSIVAKELDKVGYDVVVSDLVDPKIGVRFVKADLDDVYDRSEVIKNVDLVVCALPAKIGYGAVKSAIIFGKDCVDMSYCEENILDLDNDAKYKKVKVLPDCGVAPGLSNLVAGRAMYKMKPQSVSIRVGGFAADPSVPLGYATTWSPEDLLLEFERPARIIKGGKIITEPPLSGSEIFDSPLGELEAFYTDGLRTILRNHYSVPNIEEKTVRRSGHMKYTKKLLKDGTFVDYISRSCVGSDDVLYMKISADDKEECLIVRSNNISAMSRATAHSCVAFIRALADGFVEDNGVMAPEILAQNDDFYSYIMDILASYGIMFREQNKVNYPFWK